MRKQKNDLRLLQLCSLMNLSSELKDSDMSRPKPLCNHASTDGSWQSTSSNAMAKGISTSTFVQVSSSKIKCFCLGEAKCSHPSAVRSLGRGSHCMTKLDTYKTGPFTVQNAFFGKQGPQITYVSYKYWTISCLQKHCKHLQTK